MGRRRPADSARARGLASLAVAAFLTALLPVGPAHAAVPGSITGRITGSGGVPLAGVQVEAWGYLGESAQATSGADGTYTLTPVPPGEYEVYATPPDGSGYLDDYFGSGYGTGGRFGVAVVASGSVRSGIDVNLDMPGSISGVVTGPGGAPIAAGGYVWATDSLGYVQAPGLTAATGAYVIAGLRPGQYELTFYPPAGSGLAPVKRGGLVDVTSGATAGPFNGQLVSPGGSISGTVLGPDGAPAASVQILTEVFDARMGAYTIAVWGSTATDGTYALHELAPGQYRVSFGWYSDGSDRAMEYFPDTSNPDAAVPVTVVAGGVATGISARLEAATAVRVTLTDSGGAPAVGAAVEALIDPDLRLGIPDLYVGPPSGADGVASVTGLRSGRSARVVVGRASGETPYVAQYYRVSGTTTSSYAEATLVQLNATTAASVSMTLRTGGQIAGVVRNADGTAAPGRQVVAFVDDTALPTRSATTGADGSYTIRGLLPGSYQVAVAGFHDTFYATGTKPAAPNVVVIGTATTLGIDITLGTRFTDVQPTYPFYSYITWLADRGISTGWADVGGLAAFRPTQAVTREAMAAFLYRDIAEPGFVPPVVSPFTDVPTTYPFYSYISWLAGQRISTGWVMGDGTAQFRPTEAVSREAMAAFLYRAAGSPVFTPPAVSPFTDVATSYPFYKQIAWLAQNNISTGWVMGDGTKQFRPLQPVTREAMAAFLQRADTLLNP